MLNCCQLRNECTKTLKEIIKEGEGIENKRPVNLKMILVKEQWTYQTYLLLKNKGQALCSKCFYFTKDIMKMCEPLEKLIKRENK